ncbi:hypothetical protein [Nocardia gipuzkoensis]
MTHPNLLERYQARRTRRFEFHAERWAHMLPRWRTRRRRRLLVVALATRFLALYSDWYAATGESSRVDDE